MRSLIDNTQIRWIFCTVVLCISLLLIGSVRVNGEKKMLSRRVSNRESCRAEAKRYSIAVPVEFRNAWNDLAAKNPELALLAETGRLYEAGTAE